MVDLLRQVPRVDLVGNRLTRLTDVDGDGIDDEAIHYTYDANDRLLTESKGAPGAAANL